MSLFLAGACLLNLPAGQSPAAEPGEAKPNFVVILLDDQGWGDAQAFGHPYMKTPNIDRLARGGARFTQFYVNLWTLVPHAYLNPTPEELAVYKDLRVQAEDFPSWMRQYVRDAKNPTEQMRVFCAAMTGLDQALGRLLDFLDAQGLSENTLIIFSSDNGPEDYHIGNASNAGIGSPGVFRARKRSLYEGGIRTPLVVRWPQRIQAGRIDETSVLSAVDFLPTVCKLAGVELPAMKLDGEDASDILLGKSRPRVRPIFWEWRGGVAGDPNYRPPRLAVRDGPWKLFCEFDGSNVQLYNIPADPEERTSVAAEHPEIVGPLKEKVLAWKKTLPEGPVASPQIGKGKPPGAKAKKPRVPKKVKPLTQT